MKNQTLSRITRVITGLDESLGCSLLARINNRLVCVARLGPAAPQLAQHIERGRRGSGVTSGTGATAVAAMGPGKTRGRAIPTRCNTRGALPQVPIHRCSAIFILLQTWCFFHSTPTGGGTNLPEASVTPTSKFIRWIIPRAAVARYKCINAASRFSYLAEKNKVNRTWIIATGFLSEISNQSICKRVKTLICKQPRAQSHTANFSFIP